MLASLLLATTLASGNALAQSSLSSAAESTANQFAAAAKAPLPAGAIRRFGSDRFRFAGRPLASALSADRTRLAILSFLSAKDHVLLRVFDADTGLPICRATVASGSYFQTPRVAFSPDGRYVAAAINSGMRLVWSAATGELVTKLPPSQSTYSLCQFTPGGFLALTEDSHTDLYEIPSGRLTTTWPVGRIARLTPDAKLFVCVDKEFDCISIGDPAGGTILARLTVKTADNGAENGLAFSADGTRLAVVHNRQKIQIWDTATRQQLAAAKFPWVIDRHNPHYSVFFSPDGAAVFYTQPSGEVVAWDTHSLKPLPELRVPWPDYGAAIRAVHWSKDQRTMLGVAGRGLVLRWDAQTGKRIPEALYNVPICFALTPNGSELLAGDLAGRIDVTEIASGRIVRQLARGYDGRHSLVRLAVSPDGRRVAAGEGHCDIRLLPIDAGRNETHIFAPSRLDGGWMSCLAWAPDGNSIFVNGSGMLVCRLNLANAKIVWTVDDENMPVFALTPDGRFVIKALWTSLQFLDAATGKESSLVHITMTEKQGPVRAVTVAPDGKHLAAVIGARTVLICDAAGRELRRFEAAESRPFSTPLPLGRWREERYRVLAVAFSPDGKWLISGADDLSVRVWETATGKLVMPFLGHEDAVNQVAVAPDGRSVFSAGADGFIYQWDLSPRPEARPQQQVASLWAAAADLDPATAVPAAWALVTWSDESRAYTALKLRQFGPALREQIAKWLADLDSPVFADREAATRALARQGRPVVPDLRHLLQTTQSAEVRRRAEDLIARLENSYTPEELRALRIVQACELSATTAARNLLHQWASQAPGTLLTDEATAAATRLDRRPHQDPAGAKQLGIR
jgi:WD40 repeat protein